MTLQTTLPAGRQAAGKWMIDYEQRTMSYEME
jgi:hypothetical protein